MTNLKPCPHCGSSAVSGANFDDGHYVMCVQDNDKCGGMVGWQKTEERASAVWNRRADPFTPAERQYLLRLLGGSLELAEGFTAQDVLVLRGKVEEIG